MKKLLLIVVCLLFTNVKIFAQDVPQSERDALIAFYDALRGDFWQNTSGWKSSSPVSQWYGINKLRNSEDFFPYNYNNVYRLKLPKNGLVGAIPASIVNLTLLEDLILSENYITSIPNEIGLLSNLKIFKINGALYANGDIDFLPATLGQLKKLEYLDVSNNKLQVLPEQIGQLESLKYLNISNNRLRMLPDALSTLVNLETFICSGNEISGTIPDSYSKLINLKTIKISEYGGLTNNNPNLFVNMKKLDSIQIFGYPKIGKTIDLSQNVSLKYIEIFSSNTEIYNLNNNNNKLFAGSYVSLGGNGIKCVSVDDFNKARRKTSPYENFGVSWASGYQNNFQSDCSSYLSTNEIKVSDFKIANPVKDLLNIQTSQKVDKVEIYAVTGQLVKTFKSKEGNVSDLAKGVYLIKIYTDNGVSTQKIIKE